MPAPDANIDGSGGGSGRLGLFVAWEVDPQVPGPVTLGLTTSVVELQVRSLQFLSDAGDATRSNLDLRWSDVEEPQETTFPTAPAGLYSQISIHLGGVSDSAYRVLGTWHDMSDNQDKPFRVEDRTTFAVTLDCNKMLAAAGSTEVAIKIDLTDALDHVNFSTLPPDQTGTYVLDNTTDELQIEDFRKRMMAVFVLDN